MSVLVSAPPRRRGAVASPGLPPVDVRLLEARAQRALAALCRARAELSVALVDDARMAELNGRFRGRPRATDVLAFSLQEGEHSERSGALLGDVVIGVETAWRQARRRGVDLDDEVARLLVHGVLHLVGHDHERPAERRAMRAEERRLWRAIA
jgi:probable rRNA maturation factor